MNKYSGLCDLCASAVNIFPLGFDSGVARAGVEDDEILGIKYDPGGIALAPFDAYGAAGGAQAE